MPAAMTHVPGIKQHYCKLGQVAAVEMLSVVGNRLSLIGYLFTDNRRLAAA